MKHPLHLFEAYGVELEYMLVDKDTLDVKPAVDEILKSVGGAYISDFTDGPISWSNELVRHVVEVKVTEPVATLKGLAAQFDASVRKINGIADRMQAQLLPTAMHPWMDPKTETRLWPHEYADIYKRYHDIFDCYRHGWANLQSVHLNLPFCGDEEFARLHAAIRLVLPLIPAIAASSPVMEGRITGHIDTRLDVYCANAVRIPEVAGEVIPEPVFSESEYRETIFKPMYKAIAPYDPDGTLQDEFLNSRGAIARFDRNAIEIRLIDVQECPLADLAIVQMVVHAIRMLTDEQHCTLPHQQTWRSKRLKGLLLDISTDGEETLIRDAEYLALWGVNGGQPCTANQLWRHIVKDMPSESPELDKAIDHVLKEGTLSRRMLRRIDEQSGRSELKALYDELADCLKSGRMLL